MNSSKKRTFWHW